MKEDQLIETVDLQQRNEDSDDVDEVSQVKIDFGCQVFRTYKHEIKRAVVKVRRRTSPPKDEVCTTKPRDLFCGHVTFSDHMVSGENLTFEMQMKNRRNRGTKIRDSTG